MATFKVGQRVKKIRNSGHRLSRPVIPIGAEGIITARAEHPIAPEYALLVRWDGRTDGDAPDGSYWAVPDTLAPLTDPKADAFIEQVKKWKPEPTPAPIPKRERIEN